MRLHSWWATALCVALTTCVREPRSSEPAARAHGTPPSPSFAEHGPRLVGCGTAGVERCFNAWDDDCNGIADEGCGVPQGGVQFLAAWDDPEADVDVIVSDPNGQIAGVGVPTLLGLVKIANCPMQPECHGLGYEAVYSAGALNDSTRLPGSASEPGAGDGPATANDPAHHPSDSLGGAGGYHLELRLQRAGPSELPLEITWYARVGRETYQGVALLSREGQSLELPLRRR